MKTQISRWSDDPAKRRSGIYQQQGRMISDADLNELVELLKRRVDDALADVVGSGTPRSGGVGLVSAGPLLRPGTLYADGVRARLAPATAGAATFALNAQADFPSPPAWPASGEQVLYADIWELTTTALQDTTQLDPGLHGADTSSRTQMLAQVKWCPSAVNPLTAAHNPRKGDATLEVAFREGQAEADPCDPCAAEIALDARVGNYLFRLEVHDVQGAADAPTGLTLKWSGENGAEQHAQADVPAEYKRGDWIYEFYNDTTERHLGVQLATGAAPQRAILKDGWPAAADLPAPATYPYVRRWDGYAVLARSGGTWSIPTASGALQAKDKGRVFEPLAGTPRHGHFTLGTGFVAYLSGLTLTLALAGKKFVAGDFWLATVREDAEGADRVQQTQALPTGIEHHYVVLARANGAAVLPFDDADTRRLSFPRLTDLTADHVGYDPAVKAARWTDVIDAGVAPPANVQAAIDTLIDKLESSDISYDLPACMTNTLRALLFSAGPATQKIDDLLDRILCFIDSGSIPYTAGAVSGTIKSALDLINAELPKKVNKAGDTMTGGLVVNPAPAVPLSVDVRGTLQTEQFKLIAPAGTPNRAVLTYESATGFARWLETSLTAWQLTAGNLSTDATAVTGSVTIGRPTTINGNLQVNGALTGSAASAFAPASHNHDARYLSLVYNNSQDYAPSQERTLTTLVNRPGIVTFAYNVYDGAGVLQTGTTYVNGPFSRFIEVRVVKIAGTGGGFDKDYRIVVRNTSTARLYISVEAFE